MADSSPHIVRAWLESLSTGVVELARDWTDRSFPRFTLGEQCAAPGGLARGGGQTAAFLDQDIGSDYSVADIANDHGVYRLLFDLSRSDLPKR